MITTKQIEILKYIQSKGTAYAREMTLDRDYTNILNSLKRMEEKKLIIRYDKATDERDRRVFYKLTKKGVKVLNDGKHT